MTRKTAILAESSAQLSASQKLLRRIVLDRLERLHTGRIVVIDRDATHEFGAAPGTQTEAIIEIVRPDAYATIALGGSVGAGESYMRGDWRCSGLTDLVRILLRNRDVLDGLDEGLLSLARKPLLQLLRWRDRNTRQGARRNIGAHYDLGNDLFELFLDPTMMYSSAVYPRAHCGLDEAAVYKLDLICRKLELQPGDHLLEIGTGWGGLALHAARHYGCKVTTTTISREQYELARRRVREAGLEARIELRLDDYRDLGGRYDKIVSVEMIEAVGHEFYEDYFRRCCQLLAPDGRMLLQAITIADCHYERAKNEIDFIKRYIFPGGCLPSNTAIQQALTSATDLQIVDLHDIGLDYARTLAAWRERFCARLDDVRALGYDERFVRMWLYYLCYCEGAFLERATSAAQYLLARPQARTADGWQRR